MKILFIVLTLTAFSSLVSYGQCNIIYASNDGTGTGEITDPADLTSALAAATAGDIIRLDTGLYLLDNAIDLIADVTIEGGYIEEDDWAKTSDPAETELRRTNDNAEGPAGQDRIVAVYGDGISNFSVRNLMITTEDAAILGRTTYGVHLTNCSDYTFSRVMVYSGNGGDGNNGGDGTDGGDGSEGLPGNSGFNDDACDSGTGGDGGNGGGTGFGAFGVGGINSAPCNQPGAVGGNGSISTITRAGGGGGGGANGGEGANNGATGGTGGGVFGTYGANSGVGSAGNDGGCPTGATGGGIGSGGLSGVAGANGADGSAPAHVLGFFQIGTDGANGTNGSGGQGGAGGGSGGGQSGACTDGSGSGGGGGGGGGEGGTAGTGGTAGGGSFSIYLYNNGTGGEFVQCNAVAGDFGTGGNGGAGGAGGAGGDGGPGASYTGGSEVGAGGDGGDGGNGGNGGSGGDGADGANDDIFINGGTTPSFDITFDLATQPLIVIDYEICAFLEYNFTATFSGSWGFGGSASPSAGLGLISATTYDATGYFDLSFAGNTYDELVYVSTESSTLSEAGDDITVCEGEASGLSVSGNTPTLGTGGWTSLGPATVDSPASETSSVSGLVPGSNLFVWTIASDCCPSSDTVEYFINPETPSFPSVSACESYTVPSGDETYFVDGVYNDTIPTAAGCDSVMTITVTFEVIDVGVTVTGTNFVADLAGESYQWVDCDNDYAPIAGATNQLFVPTINGNYAVIISTGSCSDTSDCIAISDVGISQDEQLNVRLYPNPTTDFVYVENPDGKELQLRLYNTAGKLVREEFVSQEMVELSLSDLPKGTYHVQIIGANEGVFNETIVKQ